MMKVLTTLLLLISLSACQVQRKRPEGAPQASSPQTIPAPSSPEEIVPPPLPPPPAEPPKLGLILGPGFLKTYAHVGFLQELEKSGIVPQQISGLEMGALVAGLYSVKGQSFDTEWQMMKLNESDVLRRGLLSQGRISWMEHRFLKEVFPNSQAQLTKVAFFCPSLSLRKSRSLMMTRGPLVSLMPFCLSHPPYSNPVAGSVGGLHQLKQVIEELKRRSPGLRIVYVDLLDTDEAPLVPETESEASLFWNSVRQSLLNQSGGVDLWISIPMKEFSFDGFQNRREMIESGRRTARNNLENIQKLLFQTRP